jgi:hypothetical protein
MICFISRHVQQSDAAMTSFELNLIDKLEFPSRVKTRHVHNSKASDSKSNTSAIAAAIHHDSSSPRDNGAGPEPSRFSFIQLITEPSRRAITHPERIKAMCEQRRMICARRDRKRSKMFFHYKVCLHKRFLRPPHQWSAHCWSFSSCN